MLSMLFIPQECCEMVFIAIVYCQMLFTNQVYCEMLFIALVCCEMLFSARSSMTSQNILKGHKLSLRYFYYGSVVNFILY